MDTAFAKWLDLRFPTLADKHIGNIRAACALSATRPAQEAVAGVSFVFHWGGSETGPAPVS